MLKQRNDILSPDQRFVDFVLVNKHTGDIRPFTLDEHYAAIAEINLSDSVPESVRSQFDKARNIFLYAWFEYELLSVADGFAYSALELALRLKISGVTSDLGRSPGLKKLLTIAVKRGWVTDERMRRISQRSVADGFCQSLPELASQLRNEFAHGSYYVFSPGMSLVGIRICWEVITLLFT